MTALAYFLVVISAAGHAYWNYLTKRAGGGQLFVGLSKVVEAVLWGPIFIFIVVTGHPGMLQSLLPLAAIGGFLTLGVYVLLSAAYQHGDLSLVYPVSRGGILLFLPIIGFVFLGEHVTVTATIAFALIIAGIAIVQLPVLTFAALRGLGRQLATGWATSLALLTSLFGAAATAWDKHSVQHVDPFPYFYGYTVLVAFAYLIYLMLGHRGAAVRAEWARHRWPIVQVGVLNTVSYGLILFALRQGSASYIVAARQLSVAFGAFLGWRLLGESFGRSKALAVALLSLGSILVALGH